MAIEPVPIEVVDDECAIPDLDEKTIAIFTKIDDIKEEKEDYVEMEPQEDCIAVEPQEVSIAVEPPENVEIVHSEEAQDKEVFEKIFENRNKKICFHNFGPNQENVPPDFSTDKPFYHGYYEKDDGEGVGWNTEMSLFYKKSWGGESFTVNSCINKMDRKFFKLFFENLRLNVLFLANASWKISHLDQFPKHKKKSNIKCMNCCEFGHQKSMCKKPKKPLICYMCGETGHTEPRCPNTLCLRVSFCFLFYCT